MIGAITGILASRGNYYEYFTTTLFPFVVDDGISVSQVTPQNSSILWENPNDDMTVNTVTVVAGTLVDTIVYKTYNNGAIEDLTVNLVTVVSGTLVDTIVYKTYDNPLATEPIGVNTVEVISGTLVTTISYISYNNGAIEDLTVDLPIIISGTLI